MIGRPPVGAGAGFGGNPDGTGGFLIVNNLDGKPNHWHGCGTTRAAVDCMERLWRASERAGRSLSLTFVASVSSEKAMAAKLCEERGLVVT